MAFVCGYLIVANLEDIQVKAQMTQHLELRAHGGHGSLWLGKSLPTMAHG